MRKHWLRKEEVKFEERFNTRFKIMSNIIACILQPPVLTLLCVTEVFSVLFWFLKLFLCVLRNNSAENPLLSVGRCCELVVFVILKTRLIFLSNVF